MDIRNWPMNQIMQLPDHCFGRRWPIGVNAYSSATTEGWDISEVALPEQCVIWELSGWIGYSLQQIETFRLALGDQLPTTTAEMDRLEPLFNGLGRTEAGPRRIEAGRLTTFFIMNLRMPVMSSGRRLVLEVVSSGTGVGRLQVAVVVSSIPREVPDCLLSV